MDGNLLQTLCVLCYARIVRLTVHAATERVKVNWRFDHTRVGAYVYVQKTSSLATQGPLIRRATFVS